MYPIALSVRSSNVYEERSLGLDEEGMADEDEEPKTKLWGSYLAWHARKQLAFGELSSVMTLGWELTFLAVDMWWIVLALVLICVVEVRVANHPHWRPIGATDADNCSRK